MGRVEYLQPPPLDREKIVDVALEMMTEGRVQARAGNWEVAAWYAEIAMNLMKIVAIYDERVANPIRVEYPTAQEAGDG